MKIAIDCRELVDGRLTGIGRILKSILPEFISNHKDLKLVLIMNQFCNYKLTHENVKIVTVNERFTMYTDQIQIPNIVRKENADIFFSPYSKTSFLTKSKNVISILDLTPLIAQPYKHKLKSRFSKYLCKLYSYFSDKIVTTSINSKNDIVELLKIDPNRVAVIYPCIDRIFSPRNEKEIIAIRKKFSLSKDYLLYVGNPMPHKNLDRLVKAYEFLPEEVKKQYNLVLAGTHAYSPKIKDCITIPFVPDDDLPALYSGAKLFVFPSLYEGFGFPPLEAMACGCPVLSSDAGSLPEILGKDALYCSPVDIKGISDMILNILKDENLRQEYIKKGFARSKIFTAFEMHTVLLNIFDDIVSFNKTGK
jgi:alpha-1,3-rhamnosyl/mannosyltransferase